MHNTPNEIVFGESTERELRIIAKRAVQGKVRLSYFERQLAHDLNLDKALDAHGNLDLNEAANLSFQLGNSKRISPNVLAAGFVYGSDGGDHGEVAATNKAMRGATMLKASDYAEGELGRHNRYCKMQGRTCCSVCHGIGIEGMAKRQNNQSRNLV